MDLMGLMEQMVLTAPMELMAQMVMDLLGVHIMHQQAL